MADPKSSLAGLRAIQWLNYTVTYMQYPAYGTYWNLDDAYDCFKTLIEACEIVIANSLTNGDIDKLTKLLYVEPPQKVC